MPKAGVLFPLKAPSGQKRSYFVDNDEERLDQDGRILVYDLVYYAEGSAQGLLVVRRLCCTTHPQKRFCWWLRGWAWASGGYPDQYT